MIEGTLIAESLRPGTNLQNLGLLIRAISRYRAQGTTADQPDTWTTFDFEADEAQAEELAGAFAGRSGKRYRLRSGRPGRAARPPCVRGRGFPGERRSCQASTTP